MKNTSLIISMFIAVAMVACTSPDGAENIGDTVVNNDTLTNPDKAEIRSMCFLRTEGKANKDTTSVELVIENNAVTGQMYWHPFEKDSRRGTLNGTLHGDTVHAVWSFMQEGVQDTLALQFLIKGDDLMQKPLKLNTTTGREQTDANAGFTVVYQPSVSLKKK